MQEKPVLEMPRAACPDGLANRSKSVASHALLCLKRCTYLAVFVKFVSSICPGSRFRDWKDAAFFRLEF